MKYTYEQPEYLDVNGVRHLVQELKAYILEIMNGNIDITQYATKEELSSYAKTTDIPTLDGYATTEYVDKTVADVATSGEIDLSNYATKSEIPSLEGYATETYVTDAIGNIEHPTTDLSNYYTKDEVYNKEETDTLIANINTGDDSGATDEGGTEETPTEPTTSTVTMALSGNASLKNGFARTYKAVYTDESGTDVTANYSTTWELTSSNTTATNYITQELGDNQIKLLYEDEDYDVEGETVTLTAIPSDSTIANASIELTLASAF